MLRRLHAWRAIVAGVTLIACVVGGAPGPAAGQTAAPPPATSPMPMQPTGTGQVTGGLRIAAWSFGAGAVVVGLGMGAVLQLVANEQLDYFNGGCLVVGGHPVANENGGRTDSYCASLYDTWQTERTISIIGYTAGAALAVTSGILFWKSSSSAPTGTKHAHFSCAPGPGSVACRGEF